MCGLSDTALIILLVTVWPGLFFLIWFCWFISKYLPRYKANRSINRAIQKMLDQEIIKEKISGDEIFERLLNLDFEIFKSVLANSNKKSEYRRIFNEHVLSSEDHAEKMYLSICC